MIPNLRPTSKASLKQMCLYSAKGDLDKAQQLYDYMIKDMDDLPLFDAVQPTVTEQIKSGVSETMQFISQNQDQILMWVDVFRSMFNKGNKPTSVVGNIVSNLPNATINPLPPINQ